MPGRPAWASAALAAFAVLGTTALIAATLAAVALALSLFGTAPPR